VSVNAAQLTMQAEASGQNVYVTDAASGTVTLAPCTNCTTIDNSANGIYNLTDNNATNIVTASGETVTAGTLNVTDRTGTIGMSCSSAFSADTANVTATAGVSAYFTDSYNSTSTPITISNTTVGTASADTFFLEATGSDAGVIATSGSGITGTFSGTTPGTAGAVVLVSDNGSVGTSTSAVSVNAAQLTMQAEASGQNVYVTDAASGTVTLAPCTNCTTIDNSANGIYNLTDNNATNIVTAAGETVTAGTLNVTDTVGTVGTSCSSAISTDTANVTVTAGISAYFNDDYSSLTTPVTITNSTVGTATRDTFFLEATSASIATGGTGITGTAGATASVAVLDSDTGSIGTSNSAVTVNAAQLTMQAAASGQNVYVNDIAGGTIMMAPCPGCTNIDNTAGGNYNMTANNAGSVLTAPGETVTAGSLNITANTGTIGTSCASGFSTDTANLQEAAGNSAFFFDSYSSPSTPITITSSTVSASGEFFLLATSPGTATGNIATAGTGITAPGNTRAEWVILVSENGSIGTKPDPVLLNATQLTLQAKEKDQNVIATDLYKNFHLVQCKECNYINQAGNEFIINGSPYPPPGGLPYIPQPNREGAFTTPEQNYTEDELAGTKIPTDQTPVLEGNIEEGVVLKDTRSKMCNVIDGSYTFASDFSSTTGESARLASEGVTVGTKTNGDNFVLDKGNVVFAPNHDITVNTRDGKIFIPKGAIVFVMESGEDSAIFDLHQNSTSGIKVESGDASMSLYPGRMIALSRQQSDDYEHVKMHCRCVGYRQIETKKLSNGIHAFNMDFSIPSALSNVLPLRQLLNASSGELKSLRQKIIMTAVMLQNGTAYRGPFHTIHDTN
jgi:cytochrome c2